ncbi:hypothetical protein BJ878DRAFT_542659 [Calycina marina]|uniref:Chorismate synthase protein n=1 Tax=Calycina marina TaxID=1763456 RepID=A0A9P7Z2Q7_9HELO|nr:hypothetical protein BJ878DRAFT_542659 [Calycina marina]
MAVSFGTIKSLALFFGPILLPKAISYYRAYRNAPSHPSFPVRAIPPKVLRALLILLAVILSYLLKALPPFSIENIFQLTSSRLQIPTETLFHRVAKLRPQGTLTAADEVLRGKITSQASRLLFFQYGPAVLKDCVWCSPDDSSTYFYYAIPGILVPHLLNLCVLALLTSGLVTGKEGATGRRTATYAALFVAAMEVYWWASYDIKTNARATREDEIDVFFQRIRTYRLLGLALLDALLGYALYLSSTNRFFVTPPSAAERVESAIKTIAGARNGIGSIMILKNTIQRDKQLREVAERYWIREGMAMSEAMEDREVVEGVQNALEERIDMAGITRDADAYARSVVEVHGLVKSG